MSSPDKDLTFYPRCDKLLFRHDSEWGLTFCDKVKLAYVAHACGFYGRPFYSSNTICGGCSAEVPAGLTALRQLYNGEL